MATGYEDLLPQKKSSSGGYEDLIPTGGAPTVAPTSPAETGFEKVLRKGAESASMVGPIGLGAAGALKIAGRAPQAVRAAAGPIARGAERFAKMFVPQTGRGLAAATGSAGIAGGSAEAARQLAESQGAGPVGQTFAETAGALAPSGARVAAQRATAPVVEAMGKRLYSVPPTVKTPEKEQALKTAREAGMRVLPGQIRESRSLQMTERLLQLLPGSKEEFVRFGRQNQEAANRAVAKAFGGLEPSIAPAAMQSAKSDLQRDYNTILGKQEFRVDSGVANKLAQAFNQNEELKNFALANSKVSQFAQSLAQGQKINGEFWKEVRSDIAEYVYGLEGASRLVGRKVLESFDDIAKNNLSKVDYDALRGVDRKYAALKSFEDAFRRDPSLRLGSDVDINKFARQYANVEPENVLYGRTGGRGGEYVPLATLGEQYKIFTKPRIPQSEATTLGGLLRAGTGLSLFGGGLAGDIPLATSAGIGYMAAPPVASRAARAYLEPEKTAAALREAGITPFATYPMLTQERERK